jgi:hypothetical protein
MGSSKYRMCIQVDHEMIDRMDDEDLVSSRIARHNRLIRATRQPIVSQGYAELSMTKLFHVATYAGHKILIPSSIPVHLRKFIPDVSHLHEEEDKDMTLLKSKAFELLGKDKKDKDDA